jgi:hypothetical protein
VEHQAQTELKCPTPHCFTAARYEGPADLVTGLDLLYFKGDKLIRKITYAKAPLFEEWVVET